MALGLPLAGHAAPAELEARVIEFARETVLDQAARQGWIDPQLQLQPGSGARAGKPPPPCPEGWQVQARDTRFLSRLRFVAHCPGTPAASQEVLLRGQLSAEVLVAAVALAPGRPIGEDAVQLERRDISNAPEALSQLDAVLGLSPRGSVRAGQLLLKRQLQETVLVRRGQKLQIRARGGGIEVSAPGEALESGARDAHIRVRNLASGRVIGARVVAAGLVEPAEP